MAKASKNESNKLRTAVIVFIAVVVALSFVLLTVNCMGKAQKLTATYNGKFIKSGTNFILPYSGEAEFEFAGYDGELIIEILPNVNAQTDFKYTVDGQAYKFSETELTSVFISEVTDGKFSISCEPGTFALENVLITAQSGEQITSEIPHINYPFKLVAATTAGQRIEFGFVQFDIRFEPDGGHIF